MPSDNIIMVQTVASGLGKSVNQGKRPKEH